MKQVHVECLPDALLVSKLGFTKRLIKHHHGKAKVFNRLNRSDSVLAMVDEDPGSGKSGYEKSLMLKDEKFGIKYYLDANQNKICILSGELEAWILDVCTRTKIDPTNFGLPGKYKELKKVILFRLDNLGRLLDELVRQKNPSIMQLKSWLK